MAKKQNVKATEAELAILQILWQNGPSTVKIVNEKLGGKKEVGYTTTLKLLQIMYDKGLVTRNEDERSHVYTPSVKESEMQKALVDKLLESVFSGSAAKLVMHALGNSQPSKEELDKIRKLLNKIERDRK